ncbi:hypothetical protein KL949_000351 [Ogataea haglerorum]|nr:hypothetical protein KL949_000351 [Ogataea haglerorum]KAG7745320.1 hypothetical protein KL932_000350 [Ogataea haglerorum]KAG7761180.1 hypothetical protein KL947_000128 [Ogataea haglerorum]
MRTCAIGYAARHGDCRGQDTREMCICNTRLRVARPSGTETEIDDQPPDKYPGIRYKMKSPSSTGRTKRKHNKRYFLEQKDAWAHDPYQRFFAQRLGEPLPPGWRISADNKNTRFRHEYLPLTTKRCTHSPAAPRAGSQNIYTTPDKSPLSSGSRRPVQMSESAATSECSCYPSPGDSAIDTADLPKPIPISSLVRPERPLDLAEINQAHDKYVGYSGTNFKLLSRTRNRRKDSILRIDTGATHS